MQGLIDIFVKKHGESWQVAGYAELKRSRGIDPREYWQFIAEAYGTAGTAGTAGKPAAAAAAAAAAPQAEMNKRQKVVSKGMGAMQDLPEPEWKVFMFDALAKCATQRDGTQVNQTGCDPSLWFCRSIETGTQKITEDAVQVSRGLQLQSLWIIPDEAVS